MVQLSQVMVCFISIFFYTETFKRQSPVDVMLNAAPVEPWNTRDSDSMVIKAKTAKSYLLVNEFYLLVNVQVHKIYIPPPSPDKKVKKRVKPYGNFQRDAGSWQKKTLL